MRGRNLVGLTKSFPVPVVLKFYQHMRVSELNEIVGTHKTVSCAAQLSSANTAIKNERSQPE